MKKNIAITCKKFFGFVTKTHVLFIIVGLIFGLCFIKLTPPLWGIDEITHFARVYQIDQGHIRPQKLSGGDYGGELPGSLVSLNQQVFINIREAVGENSHQLDKSIPYQNLTHAHFTKGDEKVWDFTGSAAYSPMAYVGALIGLGVAKLLNLNIGHVIFLTRFCGLVFYLSLMALALKLLDRTKVKWIVFLTGLLPMSLFQASIVNTDSVIIAESCLLFALYIRLWSKEEGAASKKLLLLLSAILVALPLAKLNYFILIVPLLFIPNTKVSSSLTWARVYKWATLVVSLGFALLWGNATKGVAKAVSLYRGVNIASQVDAGRQLHFIFDHPIVSMNVFLRAIVHHSSEWIQGVFGTLGWNVVRMPLVVIVILSILLILATFYTSQGEKTLQPRQGVVFVGTAALTVVGILTIFYVGYNVVGSRALEGVQGRYFIPVIPFLLYGLRKVIPIQVIMHKRMVGFYFSFGVIICLFISLVAYRLAL